MNIIFLTRFDPGNINNWSGTLYHIYHKLKEKHTIEIIGAEIIGQLELLVRGNFQANIFIPSDRYIENLGKLLSERINTLDCDLIFFGDLLFIPVDINIPVVLFSDMTYEQVKIHYVKQDERNIEPCIRLEKLMLEKAFKIIYPSEWIKEKVMEFYAINPEKISIVEFGANIPSPMSYSININIDVCRLLFIGRDWERKGGDKVLEIYKMLKEEKFPCTLTIIGSMSEDEQEEDENLTVIPFLDKSKKKDLEQLCDILSKSHFFVLPTKFDAFGIVFCEASAFALPSITANVGGVGQAVKDGKNGYLLPADATANDYAQKIKAVFSDKEGYLKLRKSSRNEFETRLNWDVWGERVNKILEDAVSEWKLQK
jgi:glycosyltransferase involved in cell wall biosynthesis